MLLQNFQQEISRMKLISEKRGQQFIRSYVSSRDGQAADEEFAVVNYFDKTEAGQVVALNPIT